MSVTIEMAERRWLPDAAVRFGIRNLLAERLQVEARRHATPAGLDGFCEALSHGPIAVATDQSKAQHYEVPVEFFEHVLGPHMKYSACLWSEGVQSLKDAEEAMLALTCARAGIADGQEILDLGCGWGSLSLWIAERFPDSRILAVSHSHSQRALIEGRARERGLANLDVATSDMNDFTTPRRFDRILSIEMFEHMRNYEELLTRIAPWLAQRGELFVHVFCHKRFAYLFEANDTSDWMARHFFTGGLMPSVDLLPRFGRDLCVVQQWDVNGWHYAQTANAWLANLDRHVVQVRDVFAAHCGRREAVRRIARWRIFFMACAELFAFGNGHEWLVGHYRLQRVSEA